MRGQAGRACASWQGSRISGRRHRGGSEWERIGTNPQAYTTSTMCPPPPPAPAPTPPPASRVEPVGLGATRRDRWAPGCAENRPNPVRGMGLDGVCVSVSVCVCVLRGPSCVPSLLGPSESGRGRCAAAVFGLSFACQISCGSILFWPAGPVRCISRPGVHRAHPRPVPFPTYANNGSGGQLVGGGGGGDCLGWLAGWLSGRGVWPHTTAAWVWFLRRGLVFPR